MTDLDLGELRSKLNGVHESQGVQKSVVMKLMQELEETRAKWRKEWGRAMESLESLNKVREIHRHTYSNASDEVWGSNPICTECRVPFPCETRTAVDPSLSGSLKQCKFCGGGGIELFLSDWGTGETSERKCTGCGGEGLVIDND